MTTYDFSTVIDEYSRLCETLQKKHCTPEECPISKLIAEWENEKDDIWDERCITFARENPNAFSEAVMNWAKENPRKIYPTIGEVARHMAITCGLTGDDLENLFVVLNTRLNDKTADFYGILPINEGKL